MENLVEINNLYKIYNNKKIFVTGHTGFKGSWLSAVLNNLGAIVKGYALEPENEYCLFNILNPTLNINSVVGDIRNKEKLKKEILDFQPDFIFHLAAQPLVRRSYKIPAETFEVNVSGTANLLEVVTNLNKKCSVIIVTTDKVYENKEQDILYNEMDRLGGYDPYSASKACTEIVVSSFRDSFFNIEKFDNHQKAIASVRAGNVIGGGDFSEDRIIPDIIRSLKNGNEILIRNPNSVRPWQHVLEPLFGYLILGGLLNESSAKYSGAYNFGPSPQDHLKVKELVDLSIKIWGSGSWIDKSDADQLHEASLLKLDINKAKEVLNWKPKLNAQKAISMTIEWYKQKLNIPEFTFDQIKEYMSL